ncbi:MAG: DUF3303 domain-containing protein [Phycisphaerales bacterium]
MLYMIVETFRSGTPDEVGARFKARGRLMPEDAGLAYVASWMTADGARCYQLMEAPSRSAFDGWIANWSDLVDFEVTEVKTSAEFWSTR